MGRNRAARDPLQTKRITADTELFVGDHVDLYLVDVASDVTLTTMDSPAPADGDEYQVLDAGGHAGTHPITVRGGTEFPLTGLGVSGNAVQITVANGAVTVTFSAELGAFVVTEGLSGGGGPPPSQTSKYDSSVDGDVVIPDLNVNIVADITGWTDSHTITLPAKTAPGRVTIGNGDNSFQSNIATIATAGGQHLIVGGFSITSIGVTPGVNGVIELDTDGDGHWWFIVPNPVEA